MKNDTGITPLNDIVLVEPEKVEEVSKGGIVIAQTAREAQEIAQIHGKIIAMGDGCIRHPATKHIVPGDTVVFGKWSGLKYDTKGKKFRLIRAEDIIAKIDADAAPEVGLEGRARQDLGEAPPLTLQA